jgi:signal transduction histidine kinase/DNA-binding response OmpR family regulator
MASSTGPRSPSVSVQARRRREQGQKANASARAERLEALQDQVFALTDQVEKLTTALSAAGDIVLRHGPTPDDRVQAIGPAFEAMFEGTPDDILRQLAVSPEGSDGAEVGVGPDRPLQTRHGRRWFTHTSLGLPGPDGAPVRHTVLRDVTDRKAIEAALAHARDSAEAASEAKSRFLALASHELRTPLNGILGMAGLLMETPLTPEQESYARAIQVSGEALLAIVGDVLDHARIEAGRLTVSPAPTDIGALIQDVVELLAPKAQAKSIELAADLGPGLPTRLLVDGARLRQVLLNLAGNAIKFTETGGVAVRARVCVRGEGPRLAIVVEDTGIGLAPADAARVFEEFEQADQGAARRADGTGLGLPIARAIVRAMDGDITLESALGRGSIFSFNLPMTPPEATDAHPVPPRLAGRRILVVAEAAIEPPILCRRLAEAGAQVGRAPDLIAARIHLAAAIAKGEPFDTVLVDFRLVAEAEGRLAMVALRTQAPTPLRAVVLMTPAERSALEGLRAHGFDGYLTRPVRPASLVDVMARLGDERHTFASDPGDRRAAPVVPQAPRSTPALDVLVVDDNPINGLLARAVLTRLGHRVEVVADGMAALVAVRRGPMVAAAASGSPSSADPPVSGLARPARFAAVLTDLHMPGRDGFDVMRAIRSDEAALGLPRARLIAVTADARPDVAAAVAEAGGDATVTKPFDPAHLAALLATTTATDAPSSSADTAASAGC